MLDLNLSHLKHIKKKKKYTYYRIDYTEKPFFLPQPSTLKTDPHYSTLRAGQAALSSIISQLNCL